MGGVINNTSVTKRRADERGLGVRAFAPFLVVVVAFAASACATMPGVTETEAPTSGAVVAVATPNITPRERVRLAIEQMSAGQAAQAQAELDAALVAEPNNATARRLRQQIDGDAAALIGPNAQPYVVRSGETMSQLAERFLGDGLLFYALARFNGLDAPNQITAGQTLMIPRRPGVHVASPGAQAPAAASAPTANATRANQLRLQALQQLNSGAVDGAVALLRQARTLDGSSTAIQRDLDRALRLQASLRAPTHTR
jgi:hypothetical protein